MIGICIKAGFTCPDCDSSVPMNALVRNIRCSSCGTEHDLTVDHWKTVLDDAIREAPHNEEGEGSQSTVFGNFNYRIEYGRLKPRYTGTKDDIPVEDILEHLEDGYVSHPVTGEKTFIRKLPDIFGGEFSGIVALIGEETSMIPRRGEGTELQVENSSDPIAMQCPSCGGSLIVNGESRAETCGFCDTRVYLPDDLWKILHPVKKAIRWYFLFDYSSIPFSWEGSFFGCAAAADGGVCLVVENEHGDMPIITCLRSDRTQIWMRDDLELECRPEGSVPGLVADYGGNALIMHESGTDIYSISLIDGSVTSIPEGDERSDGADRAVTEPFGLDGVSGMTSFPDGSIMLLKSRDDEEGYYSELVRFDRGGNPLPLWEPDNKADERQPGFFVRLFGRLVKAAKKPGISYFTDIGDRPSKLKDSDVEMVSGPDGSLYLLNSERIAAFDRYGYRRYSVTLPCERTWGRPVAGLEGTAFILTEKEDNRYEIQMISSSGIVSTYAASVKEGGKVEDCDSIVLTSDGKIHAFGYGGVWISINAADSAAGESN